MFCKNCGAKIQDGISFCTNCGQKVEVPVAANNVQNTIPEQKGSPFQQQFNPNPQQQQFNPNPQPQQQQFNPNSQPQQFNSNPQQQQFNQNSQPVQTKKYCRNCGSEVVNGQVICTKCGVKVGEGTSFCPHCAAPVQSGAEHCLRCGKSIKPAFDIGKYFKQFGENITNLFKTNNILQMIIENFSNFAAVVVFIVALCPIIAYSAIYYVSYYNVFSTNGFAGFLIILALLCAIAKYEPFCAGFIKKVPILNKLYVFIVPALEFISLLIVTISFFNLSAANSFVNAWSSALTSHSFSNVYFTFGGWLFIIFVAASVADSIYLFIKNNKKQ